VRLSCGEDGVVEVERRLVWAHSENQHLKPRLVVRWMLSGHVRQILWRQEFDGDVLLSLDRPVVHESGLVTPQANSAHCGRKKRDRAAHELYIQHLAERSDSGADLYGF
jgi:hypothetical protein